MVPIIVFRKAKSLKDIFLRAKVPPVKKNEGYVDHVKNQDVKFVSTWLILIVSSHQQPNSPTVSDQKI